VSPEPPPGFTEGAVRSAVESVLARRQPIGWREGDGLVQEAQASADPADAIYLPLTVEQRMLGVLYLRLPAGRRVLTRERRIIESLANLAVVVMERCRLTRAEAEAAVLQEADRLKTALLSMVSHDFRTPLASMKVVATGLLQDGISWDAATQRELFLTLNQEIDRLNRMVGNILDLSRLEAGAWRPQFESTPLVELTGAALGSFSAVENRRIQVTRDPAVVEVWLDPVQMVQVLHNLVDNALKYSPEGSLVELHALRREDEFVIEVLDRGPGLPEGDEEHLFQRFYRAPTLQARALPGVGIGLALCRGLVEAHGGRLAACNRDGGGAIFQITMPLRPIVKSNAVVVETA
jgi:two-component system sensor histidine kinase KdpD